MSVSATPGTTYHQAPRSAADEPIARPSGAVVAFVGRTLRGPINQPVSLRSFAEYQQEFGGLWQISPLSYAVEQFFEQGGRHAIVVRVCNGGAPSTIELPGAQGPLTLRALAPGTREFLRAAVDYDNLGVDDQARDCFNLVVQRVRGHGSERIEVQETFRRVSVHPGTQRFVANVLLESALVRVHGDVPAERPHCTTVAGSRTAAGYAESRNDGHDGEPLTNYDIIGSATARTGLFALSDVEPPAYLYVPPLDRDRDVGASTLLVAERFCRRRRIMLIVDPPAEWRSVEDALQGAQRLVFRSEHAVMFFPRLLAPDRLRARSETFANGGAVAGLLARNEEQHPVWSGESSSDHALRSGARLCLTLGEVDRWRLAMQGINTLRVVRNASAVRLAARTLAGGINAVADWGYLEPQRLASVIVSSIERGTRWARDMRGEPSIRPRLARQTERFLAELTACGAFPTLSDDRAYMVVCDERINDAAEIAAGRVNLLIAFAALRPGSYHAFLITHGRDGSTHRSVSVNSLELPAAAEPCIGSIADIDAWRRDSGDSPLVNP